ncbi:MAG: carbon starvation protein A [Planctomycetota bacterium]|nr:MAG: carbon starvation protein A [Planctomycetota bacterium]
MPAFLAAALALAAYALGYRFYSRWLGNRVFQLDPKAVTPAHSRRDDIDFLPTRPLILFGHHYASIAGLAPMLGPAVAVFWGWLPALLWVVFGALLIGCVHDFSALVLSSRHRGESIGALCQSILGPFAKGLFLALIFFGVALAMGVFVEVISVLFSWGADFNPQALSQATTSFPEAVLPSAGLMLLAMAAGYALYVKKKPLLPVTLIGFSLLLALIYAGYRWPTMGVQDRNAWPVKEGWTWILLAYAYAASVLPVWLLLQARDFLNSLLLALGLVLMYLGFFLIGPEFEAPAIHADPEGAPPIFPFVFITIACGAASGFHSLVSSGTTARQLDKETHARPIGYGAMIGESLLALMAVLACTTTLGGKEAWAKVYVNWSAVQSLGAKLGIFIRGSASFIEELGVTHDLAVTLVAMVVVSFALTTLDSATRLLRFNVEEIGASWQRLPVLGRLGRLMQNRFIATGIACAAIGFFAFYKTQVPDDRVPGGFRLQSAGLTLWTLFGSTNQMIAGLALMTGTVYLKQKGRSYWPLAIPAVFMTLNTLGALTMKILDFYQQSQWLLLALASLLVSIGLGVGFTAIQALRRS